MVKALNNQALKEAYLRDAELKGLAPGTMKSYRNNLQHFLDHVGDTPATKISVEELKSFLAAQKKEGLTPRTLGFKFSAIVSFCEYLEYEGLLKNNPCPGFRKRYFKSVRRESGKTGPQRRLISVEEMRRLVHSITDIRDRAIVVLLAKTGIRRDELIQLNVEDVDWTKQKLSLRPHAKRTNNTVFFDDETGRLLKRWIAVRTARAGTETGPLFVGNRGNRISGDAVNDAVTVPASALKLHNPKGGLADRFTPHCCRHWFTTHLRRAGMTREHIAWLRGDAGHDTLDVYLHVDEEEARQSYRLHIPHLGV